MGKGKVGVHGCVATAVPVSTAVPRRAPRSLEDLMGYQGLLMLKLLVKAVTLKNCYLVMVSWLYFARRCLEILISAVT